MGNSTFNSVGFDNSGKGNASSTHINISKIDHFLDNIMSKYFVNWLVSCEAEPERKRESCGDWERSQSQSGERKWRVEWPRGEVAEGGEWSKETLSINHFTSH